MNSSEEKLKRNFKELEKEERDLNARICAISKIKCEIEKEYCLMRFGIKVGIIVVDHRGGIYRISKIEFHFSEIPWVSANPLKNDGKFSTVVRNLFDDWTVKKE